MSNLLNAKRKKMKLMTKMNFIIIVTLFLVPIVIFFYGIIQAKIFQDKATPYLRYVIIALLIVIGILILLWNILIKEKRWNNKHMDIPPLELIDDSFVIHFSDKPRVVPLKSVADVKVTDSSKNDIYLMTSKDTGIPVSNIENVEEVIAQIKEIIDAKK